VSKTKLPSSRRTAMGDPKGTSEFRDLDGLHAKKLMDKFNPFFKRNLTSNSRMDSSFVELSRSGNRQYGADTPEIGNEGRELESPELGKSLVVNLSHPKHRSTASQRMEDFHSPFRRVGRGTGGSFLDLYSDIKFESLESQEIIKKLEANLSTFRKRKCQFQKEVEKANQRQADLVLKKKDMSPEDYKKLERSANEEIDDLLTPLYEYELKIKSLEDLIKSLKNDAMLRDHLKNKDKEIAKLKKEQKESKQVIAKGLNEVNYY